MYIKKQKDISGTKIDIKHKNGTQFWSNCAAETHLTFSL